MNPDIHFTEEEFDLAERYLLGQMTDAEKSLFEEALSVNSKLKEAVDQLRLQILGIQEIALSKMLNRFHEELPRKQNLPAKIIRQFPIRSWWAVASILLAIVFCGWVILFYRNDRDKIYEAYFKPDPGLMTTMGTTDDYAFDRAMVDYKTGHYAEAIGAWMKLLEDSPQNDTLNYFIGVAFIADNNAIGGQYLEKVIATPGSTFLQDAYWYQGLNLMKGGKLKEMVVRYISQSNHPRKAALLKALQQ